MGTLQQAAYQQLQEGPLRRGERRMVLQVNTRENTFVRVTQKQYNTDLLELLTIRAREQQAHFAGAAHRTLKGLDQDIDS